MLIAGVYIPSVFSLISALKNFDNTGSTSAQPIKKSVDFNIHMRLPTQNHWFAISIAWSQYSVF